ncbi:MAG TPA: methyltransferase domain-containing protein [Bacteroidota bacterium]|nr:methyltransferase domain-containing protein [Bacteroidota bacterium]
MPAAPPTRLTARQTADHYDLIADQFMADRSPTIGLNYIARFSELLPPPATVLDVGCGTGLPIAKWLADIGFTVHGVDLSAKMLSLAKKNVEEAAFFVADIVTWKAPRQYHGIIGWDSIFHLTVDDQVKALGNIVAMLFPKGVALITCGVQQGEVGSVMFGQEFYYSSPSLPGYIALIEKSGCTVLFSEVDDSTGGGHAVICFQKYSE